MTPRSENTLALLGFKEEEYRDMRDDFFEVLEKGEVKGRKGVGGGGSRL